MPAHTYLAVTTAVAQEPWPRPHPAHPRRDPPSAGTANPGPTRAQPSLGLVTLAPTPPTPRQDQPLPAKTAHTSRTAAGVLRPGRTPKAISECTAPPPAPPHCSLPAEKIVDAVLRQAHHRPTAKSGGSAAGVHPAVDHRPARSWGQARHSLTARPSRVTDITPSVTGWRACANSTIGAAHTRRTPARPPSPPRAQADPVNHRLDAPAA
jgi:hypothetical protein